MQEASINTPLGWLQLRVSDHTLTSIRFIDQEPLASSGTNPFLQSCLLQVQQYFEGVVTDFAFMNFIVQRGTDFQQRVWKQLLAIPYGNN